MELRSQEEGARFLKKRTVNGRCDIEENKRHLKTLQNLTAYQN